jgi:hypothetical protein
MGTRTALRQSPLVAFGLMFVAAWVVFVGVGVAVGAKAPDLGNWVGRNGIGAIVGLIVLGAFFVLAVGVLAELGEHDPTPEEWPPE